MKMDSSGFDTSYSHLNSPLLPPTRTFHSNSTIRGGGRKFCLGGGGQILTVVREACAKCLGTRPLNEVQRSLMAIGGAATVRNQEMVENVHCDRFLKLF